MRKEIWGKSVLALVLSAALFAEGVAPLSVKAEEVNSAEFLQTIEETEDVNLLSVSDGNAEEEVPAETESEETTKEPEKPEEAIDTPASEESVPAENESNENPDVSENEEITEAETEEDLNNSADAVSDGNAVNEAAVSDGNAQAPGPFDFEKEIDGYIIKLHAEEGIVPEGTTVDIKKVKKVGGQKVDDLVNDVLPAESVVYDSASFDITLLKDGQEFEPDGNVSVEITLNDKLSDANSENESTSVQVFHIEDDATTTEVPADITENATDVYGDGEETVVSYDAESFSVYDVAVVLNFETTAATAEVNPVYENRIAVSQNELNTLASQLDSTVNVKSLLSSGGKCTSIQEMAEVAREAIKARQTSVMINFKLPDLYNETTILNPMLPIIWEHTGVPNEGDYVRWAFHQIARQSSIAYADNYTYGSIQLMFVYNHDAAQEVLTTQKIDQIIKNNGLNKGTDYQKIYNTYRYITTHISYDYETISNPNKFIGYSCYSAACLNNTVCEGYSLLFYRIMLSVGIDSRLVAGLAEEGDQNSGHGWNIVQLGNIYYYVDGTWDAYDPRPGHNTPAKTDNFLKGSRVDYNKKVAFDSIYHIRYPEYATADFYRVYPVSSTDYNGSEGSFVKPTSVAISQANAIIAVGSPLQLSATCLPANSKQGIRWNSSDTTVATVSDNGLVMGIRNGECEIFATSAYGGKKARCRLIVTDGRVKGLDVSAKKITVYAGSKASIGTAVFPEWAFNKSIKFKSSNKKIATVNKYGIITGKKPGKCFITCKTRDGGISRKVTVIVKKAKRVRSVKLTKKKLKLTVGSTYTLGVKFNPKKATNKNVTWKSSKPGVVSVDAYGNLVALSPGKAKITVKSEDGNHKATCIVKVR
ncbi:Transglutaminase-like superfamily protein [Butyrivibrio sp. ob235]|uniref:Ig-like domain-containing protein n=1 Tax=Butyrivibrio sp. ob235 TaxID=1761780 RepID=UPI0008C5ECE9|nr:Ig-like domain-containing protein [Butyrivibrio sp. ob235]SEK33033.1 Transglutaminase-like superfamily protein [Butyrivibrio sp. ob235]